jgi:hypothetical protein
MKYRACVYDNDDDAFWKYSREYTTREQANKAGLNIAKRGKVLNFNIVIVEL